MRLCDKAEGPPPPCHFWLEGPPPDPHPPLSQLGSIRVPLHLVSDKRRVVLWIAEGPLRQSSSDFDSIELLVVLALYRSDAVRNSK